MNISPNGMSGRLEHCAQEARKCVLLCSNCHAEVEGGVLALPYSLAGRGWPGLRAREEPVHHDPG